MLSARGVGTRCEVADFCHHSDWRQAAYDFTAAAKELSSLRRPGHDRRSDTGAPFCRHILLASRWSEMVKAWLAAGEAFEIAVRWIICGPLAPAFF